MDADALEIAQPELTNAISPSFPSCIFPVSLISSPHKGLFSVKSKSAFLITP